MCRNRVIGEGLDSLAVGDEVRKKTTSARKPVLFYKQVPDLEPGY